MGSTLNRYNASICSVTFIIANSAAKDEPIFPVRMTVVKTGASSLIKAKDKIAPIELETFKYKNSFTIWSVKTIPIKQAVKSTIPKDSGPIIKIYLIKFLRLRKLIR